MQRARCLGNTPVTPKRGPTPLAGWSWVTKESELTKAKMPVQCRPFPAPHNVAGADGRMTVVHNAPQNGAAADLDAHENNGVIC